MNIKSLHVFEIRKEVKYTFYTSLIITFLVHLYMLTNGWINKDGVYQFYATQDLSQSGRFSLTYLAGISSYFNLHYFNGLLSLIYIALTIVLIVQMFQLTSKLYIVIFALLYSAFPSVSAIFSYMYTADAYFLANLLSVASIYVIYKWNNNMISILFASALIYVSISTYQANLGYVLTLILVLLVKDLLINKAVYLKRYSSYTLAAFLGLLLYVLHFKFYEKFVGSFTAYQGINESGEISIGSIVRAIEYSIKETIIFLFNKFQYVNLFEKLNAVFAILFGLLLITFIIRRKMNVMHHSLLILCFILLPFAVHIIYFISPDVNYHILMKQHLVLIFILPLLLLEEQILSTISMWIKILSFSSVLVLCLIGFNFSIITNIYYEKFESVNKQTNALMNQVVYDIRKVENYSPEHSIVVIGQPTSHLSIADYYDKKTPANVGVSKTIVYDTNTFVYYLQHEIGLNNGIKRNIQNFKLAHSEQIEQMPLWPSKDSIVFIEDTIVIKFGEEK